MTTASYRMPTKYIVDGNNLCHLYENYRCEDSKVSIIPLLAILNSILNEGDDFFCVFDATISHKLRNNGRPQEADIIESLLDRSGDRFFRVVGGTKADGVILGKADAEEAIVMSGDLFRDYQEKYKWVQRHSNRFVRWNLLPDGLLISDGWPQSIAMSNDLHALHENLYKKITHSGSSENKVALEGDLDNLKKSPNIITRKNRKVTEDHDSSVHTKYEESEINNKDEDPEKIKFNEDRECIKKVQMALSVFFEPYADAKIPPFNGSSWEVAVKKTDLFFEKNRYCNHCFHTDRNYIGRCRICDKGDMISRPKQILQIINDNAPAGKKTISGDLYDLNGIEKTIDMARKVIGVAIYAITAFTKR